jgi:ribosomal protein L11 methyltransferase
MPPKYTFELKITPQTPDIKADLIDWLKASGVETFVEDTCDDLYLDDPMDREGFLWDEYIAQNRQTPWPGLSLYSYDEDYLLRLVTQIQGAFPGQNIGAALSSSLTEDWLSGWKDSFQPITTDQFLIYPPWIQDLNPGTRIPIEIEPAMAFGTGQHETTKLCLKALESLWAQGLRWDHALDVGTGTGILALCASKLGVPKVSGCDLDPDSILAAKKNAQTNAVPWEDLWEGSVRPTGPIYGLIFANILAPVILSLMSDLKASLAPHGGRLILSGLLKEQAPSILEEAKKFHLSCLSQIEENDWVALVLGHDTL